MLIPQNITKEDLLKAIDKIDKEGYNYHAESSYYDVLYNGKRYPPKLIVSWANIFANGEELDRNKFEGGEDTPSYKLLQKNGFEIVLKEKPTGVSYFDELKNFLKQADEGNNLKTKSYKKEYLGLKVRVSFGTGNYSKIPWIAFLGEHDTVQDGIYPVFLYYKEQMILILAYGLSETNIPKRTWNLLNPKSIKDYFKENNLIHPKNYGNSYVFKAYNLTDTLNKNTIDKDLYDIIEIYKSNQSLNSQEVSMIAKKPAHKDSFDIAKFANASANSGLHFDQKIISRFVSSLIAKPFVILTGLSGSGKTKLAQSFAMWICENENQYCIVPVGADWTNREPLLGFPNALKENDYIIPENGALKLFLEASKLENENKPYFLILDEMNLSHVERYFADFLSAMESRSEIYFHSGSVDWNGIPNKLKIPKNLFIIGTVNIDETTYMFSPKVLDRANVIEFRVTQNEMDDYLKNSTLLNLNDLEKQGINMAENFIHIAKDNSIQLNDDNKVELNKTLLKFFSELQKTGAEFGYRTASEISRFAAIVKKIETSWELPNIIDAAIMQKLLPKVHGSRRKLEPILRTIGVLCLQEGESFEDYLKADKVIDSTKIKYPISFEKILRMYDNLISNGFTSYAEA